MISTLSIYLSARLITLAEQRDSAAHLFKALHLVELSLGHKYALHSYASCQSKYAISYATEILSVEFNTAVQATGNQSR